MYPVYVFWASLCAVMPQLTCFDLTGDAQFVSLLDETGKKKANEELHEQNDKDRELAVQSLRQWVLQQKWLKSPTGTMVAECIHYLTGIVNSYTSVKHVQDYAYKDFLRQRMSDYSSPHSMYNTCYSK